MAPSGSRPVELNAFQIRLCRSLAPQTGPRRCGREGAVTLPLPVDAKKVWPEDPAFATRPPEKLSVEKSRPGDSDSGRGCVGVCFHTSKSCLKDRCQNASSSSQLQRHRKLRHQPICPNGSSCLGLEAEKAVGLIQFWPKEGTVCHPAPRGMSEATGLTVFFLN